MPALWSSGTPRLYHRSWPASWLASSWVPGHETVSGDEVDVLDAPDGEWWLQHFPHLPEEVLDFMGRVEDGAEAAARSPFNRSLRRRWERSKGLVVHLKDAREWRREDWRGYEVITIDMEENARQNLHDAALRGYLWHLAKKGLIRAVIGHHAVQVTAQSARTEAFEGSGPTSVSTARLVHGGQKEGQWRHGTVLQADGFVIDRRGLFMAEREAGWVAGGVSDPAKYDPKAEELDIPSFRRYASCGGIMA